MGRQTERKNMKDEMKRHNMKDGWNSPYADPDLYGMGHPKLRNKIRQRCKRAARRTMKHDLKKMILD